MFTEARSRTAELELLGADALAGAHLAALGSDTEAALAEFHEHGSRLGHAQRMESRFFLWTAVRDPTYIQEAKHLLDHLVEHAPEEYRASMLANVSLHRVIVEA